METDRAEQEHRSAKKKRVQGPAECLADLRQMVNNSTFSDIVFVCNDGKRVQALRKLVAGRSEVLKSLLLNGMVETTQSEIELPEISSLALLCVLEYLYTGTVLDRYKPKSWKDGFELIVASRFFILPAVENSMRAVLHERISKHAHDKTAVATLLTSALACGLCEEKDGFLAGLVRILTSHGLNTDVYLRKLSEDAFHYMLANSKGYREDDGTLTLREYTRLLQVILWYFYSSNLGPQAKERLVNFIPAMQARALSLLHERNNVERGTSPRGDASRLLSDLNPTSGPSKNSMMRLLSTIDLRGIHPTLLSKMVEPTELISAPEILNSFCFHAIQRDIDFHSGPEYVWDHAENCRPVGRGGRIRKAGSKIGLAVMKEALVGGTHMCNFNLENVCEDFVELGLFSYPSEVGTSGPEFDGKTLSEHDHAQALKFQGTEVFVKEAQPLGRFKWKLVKTYSSIEDVKGERVTFSYGGSGFEHNYTLAFGIGGLLFGVLPKGLRRRLYYPAVSFGNSSSGQVNVRI